MSSCTLISCGSFNPITLMHLRMFELAKHHMKKDKNIDVTRGVISPTNDRYAAIKTSLIPARHRIAMINHAIKDSPWLTCDTWESNQKEWVKTLPALKHYQTVYGTNVKLLCGADLVDSFLVENLWLDEHIEEILQQFGLVIVTRKGSNPWQTILNSSKSHILGKYKSRMEIVEEWYTNEISSTMIREAVRQDRCVAHLVHQDVLSYIIKNKLYQYNTA